MLHIPFFRLFRKVLTFSFESSSTLVYSQRVLTRNLLFIPSFLTISIKSFLFMVYMVTDIKSECTCTYYDHGLYIFDLGCSKYWHQRFYMNKLIFKGSKMAKIHFFEMNYLILGQKIPLIICFYTRKNKIRLKPE